MSEGNKYPFSEEEHNLTDAFEMLDQILILEENLCAAKDNSIAMALAASALTLCDDVIDIFDAENETSLAGWAMLKKAALIGKKAGFSTPKSQPELTHEALQTIKDSLDAIEINPPIDLHITISLYMIMIETLLTIRTVPNKSENDETLKQLIEATSAHLGTLLAQDLSLRSEAHDQLYKAQLLESLLEIEENPQYRQDILAKSQNLAREAYHKLQASTENNLAPVVSLLEILKNRHIKEVQ